MQCHAADEECNRMQCNEIFENASECINMHWNAYGEKLHHFWGKTTLIPTGRGYPRVNGGPPSGSSVSRSTQRHRSGPARQPFPRSRTCRRGFFSRRRTVDTVDTVADSESLERQVVGLDGECGRRIHEGVWRFSCETCDADWCASCERTSSAERAGKRTRRGEEPRGKERSPTARFKREQPE